MTLFTDATTVVYVMPQIRSRSLGDNMISCHHVSGKDEMAEGALIQPYPLYPCSLTNLIMPFDVLLFLLSVPLGLLLLAVGFQQASGERPQTFQNDSS